MFKTAVSKQYTIFAAHLRAARKRSGLTQVELAKRLAVHQTMVSKVEIGERTLDYVQTRAWCRALRISFVEFTKLFDEAI